MILILICYHLNDFHSLLRAAELLTTRLMRANLRTKINDF